MPDGLIRPHGGELIDLSVDPTRTGELRQELAGLPSWDLTPRQLCDLELLAGGGFSPLRGFLTQPDYEAVCERMRLRDGTLWPMPVTLDVTEDLGERLTPGAHLALRDPEGVVLAVLQVEGLWRPDLAREAAAVFGAEDPAHAGVAYLLGQSHPVYVGGEVEVLAPPAHHDFRSLRWTPARLRAEFQRRGWDRVVAFQTRNPMHRAHQELTRRAVLEAGARLLLHPTVGMTRPGDVDHYTRVRCYQAIVGEYPAGTAMLSLLPLAMRMGGPREAVWHSIIRKNYGATHFIVGRDHAGPGRNSAGAPFYGPYDAQQLVRAHEADLGVRMVPFREMVYVARESRYVPEDEVPEGATVLSISGTEQRRLLRAGRDLPEWFTPPRVAGELRRRYPPRLSQGLTVFFTGLPSAGKSTTANVLLARLLEVGNRSVTLLDGDLVRRQLSSELGFSREHRDLNIRRVGFVASQVTRHRGIALCAAIAPYDALRREVRAMVEEEGGFVLVHMDTPIEVCQTRDPKGLYAKARAGIVHEFTGVSNPYEVPTDAEVTVDAAALGPEEAGDAVLAYLRAQGYLQPIQESPDWSC